MLDPELIEYLERRFEAIDRRFDAIDERFEAIDRRFEANDGRFEAIDGRFEAIDGRFADNDNRFRELHILIEHLDSKIEMVAEGVIANGEALREFRVDVDRQFAEVKAVNRLSYVELERRLTALES